MIPLPPLAVLHITAVVMHMTAYLVATVIAALHDAHKSFVLVYLAAVLATTLHLWVAIGQERKERAARAAAKDAGPTRPNFTD